jgi:aldehyde:ferredoxin oxidoreductase
MESPFFRKVRHINLTDASVHDEQLEIELFEHYLGGSGIGATLFSRYPETRAIFSPGPLTGSEAPFCRGWTILFKVPEREEPEKVTLLETEGNGTFGLALSQCGLEALLLSGQSKTPSLLSIDETGATIEELPAELHHLDAVMLERALLEEKKSASGNTPALLTAGQACRSGSPLSALVHQGKCLPSNGGTGAALAELGIVALRVEGGNASRAAYDPALFKSLCEGSIRSLAKALGNRIYRLSPVLLRPQASSLLAWSGRDGTAELLPRAVSAGLIPRISTNQTPHPAAITARIQERVKCGRCPFPCSSILRLEGRFGETASPDFISFAAAMLTGVCDLPSALLFIETSRRAGLDPLGIAHHIAGKIDKGIIERGDIEAVLEEISKVAAGEKPDDPAEELFSFPFSFDQLSPLSSSVDSIRHRAPSSPLWEYRIGGWWKEVKGLPRPSKMDLEQEKILLAVLDRKHLRSASGICCNSSLAGEEHFPLFALLNAFTGWEKTPRGYMEIGRKIILQRQEQRQKQSKKGT